METYWIGTTAQFRTLAVRVRSQWFPDPRYSLDGSQVILSHYVGWQGGLPRLIVAVLQQAGFVQHAEAVIRPLVASLAWTPPERFR